MGKFERPIKKFVEKYFATDLRRRPGILEFDISNPRPEDMSVLRSGDFEIKNFRTVKANSEIKGFHFYVGKTEINISGNSAKEIIAAADNQE